MKNERHVQKNNYLCSLINQSTADPGGEDHAGGSIALSAALVARVPASPEQQQRTLFSSLIVPHLSSSQSMCRDEKATSAQTPHSFLTIVINISQVLFILKSEQAVEHA